MTEERFRGRTLGLIGCGSMAEALARGVIGAGLFSPQSILGADPDPARRAVFESLGGRALADNAQVARAADIVVIAVKPQSAVQALALPADAVRVECLWVSIMAGVPTARIEGLLARAAPGTSPRVVRVMPNLALLVGVGAAGIAPGARATKADLEDTAALFAASGVVETLEEEALDAVTALSGSGPAYFMYLMEAMVEAAEAEGLPRAVALRLAAATCRGTGKLAAESGETPAALRARVTSPGGTTAAALEVLEAAGVKARLVEAVRAAAARSRELGLWPDS